VVALGFVLLAVPAIGASYWLTFFPGVIVLGFGMAVTVAPLTTVVMNSVDQDRVGTASGINNAVARVASVVAIAVLGIVMVKAFSFRLNNGLAHLALPASVTHELQSNVTKLAGLQVPDGLDSNTNAAIKQLIGAAFISGFRMLTLMSAVLALAGAAVAWLMSPNEGSSQAGGTSHPS
jgi:hypothetical protein